MEFSKKFIDFFLLPKKLHNKVNTKIGLVIIGILIVGAVDLFIPSEIMLQNVASNSLGSTLVNILISLIFIIIVGFLDILFFAYPIADFCVFISNKNGVKTPQKIHIIVMKAYILIHFIIVPIDLILKKGVLLIEDAVITSILAFILIYIVKIYLLLKNFWISALILRTITTKIKMDVITKIITIIMIFAWYRLSSMAILFVSWNAQKLFALLQTIL